MRRTCSSSGLASCGGDAIEKLRRRPPRQQDVDVLAGLEGESLRNGQAQEQSHDIVRQGDGALDAGWQALEAGRVGAAHFKRLDAKIGTRTRLAQQDQSFSDLGIGEAERLSIGIVDLAAYEARLAGAAIAAFAAMRQIQSGIRSRIEQQLVGGYLKAAA